MRVPNHFGPIMPQEFLRMAVNRDDVVLTDQASHKPTAVVDPVAFWQARTPSRMAAHITVTVNRQGDLVTQTRLPFTDQDAAAAAAGSGPKFESEKRFFVRVETRGF